MLNQIFSIPPLKKSVVTVCFGIKPIYLWKKLNIFFVSWSKGRKNKEEKGRKFVKSV